MKTKTKTNKFISAMLAIVVILGLFAAMPLTANASTASQLKTQIDAFNPGPGSTGKLSATTITGRPVVIVSGTVTGATNQLSLNIDAGLTVQWAADYTGGKGNSANLIELSGIGKFEVPASGAIKNNGNGHTVYIGGANTVTVSGGTVSTEGSSNAIRVEGANAAVNVSGGMVSALSTPAIFANAPPNVITVSGGTVRSLYSTAIYSGGAGSAVNITEGAVYSTSNPAIFASFSAKVNLSGGTVVTGSTGGSRAIDIQMGASLNMTGGTVSAIEGSAVSGVGKDSVITVSGGFLFSFGTSILGSGNSSVIAYSTGTPAPSIGGSAVVCAWNFSGGAPTYTEGTSTDLTVNSGASAVWGMSGAQTGFYYAKGTNTGFFQIVEINVVKPPTTYTVTVNGGTGGGGYAAGATVNIKANAAPAGKVFDKWTTAGAALPDPGSAATTFTMPANAVTVTANYKGAPAATYAVTFKYNNGQPDWVQTVGAGDKADYGMDPVRSGYIFGGWFSDSACTKAYDFNAPVTANITLYAKWTAMTAPETYKVTVNGGTGGGSYAPGATVNVTANAAPAGKAFDKWTTSDGITFSDAAKSGASFTMPPKPVTVTATYMDLPAGTYAVNVLADIGGTANADVAYAKTGDTVKLTVTEGEGYMFKQWDVIDGGVSIMGDEFTMPANTVTVKALFEPVPGAAIPGVNEPVETPGETQTPNSTETPGKNGGQNGGNLTWLWILLGVLTTAAVAGGITFYVIKKRKV